MKILLAEDSKSMMLSTTAAISQSGHDVVQVHADKALYAAKDAGRNCVVKAEILTNKYIAA